MQMDHILVARSLMQLINILCHLGQLGHMPGQFGDSEMGSIWLRF